MEPLAYKSVNRLIIKRYLALIRGHSLRQLHDFLRQTALWRAFDRRRPLVAWRNSNVRLGASQFPSFNGRLNFSSIQTVFPQGRQRDRIIPHNLIGVDRAAPAVWHTSAGEIQEVNFAMLAQAQSGLGRTARRRWGESWQRVIL